MDRRPPTELHPAPRERGVAHLEIQSPAFQCGERIPVLYTRDGANVSPELRWHGAPERARSFVVLCDDPDAARDEEGEGFVHWLIWNVTGRGLPENVSRSGFESGGAVQAVNDLGGRGYDGPDPPRGDGPHVYYFRVYALDTLLDVPSDACRAEILHAMRDHVVAYGELAGVYGR